MNVKFFCAGVSVEPTASKAQVKADMNSDQVRGLIVELLCAMPEQEAAELIRTEFPDWLEA